jgi:hypothetical protein
MNSNTDGIMPTMAAFDVYLDGRRIDTVFFHKGTSIAEVWDRLVMHDMYDPDITVEEAK